ncbi:hypothetical protein H072_6038 [Dactylellina haptotyla CBS 200.50]|uniref:Uncharacterized protein n=1 Tax=Dactylellina haptotyla (strain CBS 200.50) TaxID=1284197 RepID=S8AB06_DACHA|nr:hypothetical protein H072_6038 [Dactylellina haptotyla CBS 200.50]
MPALALVAPTATLATPPPTATFNLTLSKAIEGEAPSFLPIDIQFAYNWDWTKGEGYATVLSLGSNNTVNQQMFPMGIKDKLSFMARQRFDVTIQGQNGTEDVYAYRVLLNMDKATTDNKEAAVMVGTEGDVIITTENWGATGL